MGLLRIACGVLCFVILVKAQSDNLYPSNANSGSSLTVFSKFYKHCENSEDLFRCIKQQALKLVNRAMNLQTIKLVDGVSLSRREPYANSKAANEVQSESEMRNLSSDEIDESLLNGASKLIQTFQLQFNLPKVFEFGKNEVHDMTEEGRKKKKKYLGPFLAAMAIKAGILKIAYHSIAIVAGKALIIGKIALVISAIIGLRKLVSPETHEKTTYEIVKHPHVQQSHSYSSSHGEYDSHENGGGSGQYHRSFDYEDVTGQQEPVTFKNPAYKQQNSWSPKYNY